MTAPIAGMCCANCAFFERTNEGYGECRRHAPQPNACAFITKNESIGSVKTDVHWPKVYNSNWCGQFNIRKKTQAQDTPKAAPVHKPRAKPEFGEDAIKLKDEEMVKRPPFEL
ncbi:MAG: hypothetical protein FVQ79_06920 [Planctomycetes bacterium]|nr:hypothetical protein [Planctomycetota bacterium]